MVGGGGGCLGGFEDLLLEIKCISNAIPINDFHFQTIQPVQLMCV